MHILKTRTFLLPACMVVCLFLAGCPSNSNGQYDGITDGIDEEDTARPGPVIENVSPNRGPVSGGTVVEITGENFEDGIRAFFGPNESREVEFRNPALITAAAPAGGPGPVTVRVENPDGQYSELAGGFNYTEVEGITWCALDRPASTTLFVGEDSEPFFGIIEFPGHTDGPGEGGSITAQVGYGPDGSDPESSAGWTWVDADYSSDTDGAITGDMARDEYSASLSAETAGTYDVACRFSSDGGATWITCDMSPDDFPAYSPDDAAALEVTAPPEIDFCILHLPASITMTAEMNTEDILGRIRVSGHTDIQTGEIDFITAEVGYGPDGEDPDGSSAWEWKSADFDSDTGSEDQYSGVLTAPAAPGTYDYAYRFSLSGGLSWTYCDTDGSDNGYSASNAGSMLVEEPVASVDWCKTQWPEETWTGPGFPTDPVYGRVYWSGVTEGAGAGAGITAQLGWGPRSSDPSSGGWTWEDAVYLTDADYTGLDDADEYVTDLSVAAAGDYSYGYRFSADGGVNWTYCDLDGTEDGFETDMAGYLSVVSTIVTIDWCNTQWPTTTTVLMADETEPIFGQVFSDDGGTSSPGRMLNIIAELGYGPDVSDPETSIEWIWKRVNFNTDAGSNDEYMATLSGFSSTGEYDYAYRFTGNWGATWTYCDTGGSGDGYSPAEAGSLTVN